MKASFQKTPIYLISGLIFCLSLSGFAQTPPSPTPHLPLDPDEVEMAKAQTHDVFPAFARVSKSQVRVRRKPSLKEAIVTKLEKESRLIVIDKESSWYLVARIEAPERPLGWVFADLLEIDENRDVESEIAALPTPATPVMQDGNVAAAAAPTEAKPAATAAGESAALPTAMDKAANTTLPAASQPAPATTSEGTPPVAEPLVTPSAIPTSEPAPAEPAPAESAPAKVTEDGRKPLVAFQGHSDYPVPDYQGGRSMLLELSPSYNVVVDDLSGAVDDRSFRGGVTIAYEFVPTIYTELFYSYVGYTPDLSTHEGGGGLRWQQRLFWRFKPYLSAGAYYSNFQEDDNWGLRGVAGLNFLTSDKFYQIQLGPRFEYNHLFAGSAGDLRSFALGLSLTFCNIIAD